jgi:hypothetical protein
MFLGLTMAGRLRSDLKDRRIPFLFFANKMDQAGCLTPFECCSSLKLDDIKSKPWHITYDARSAAAVRGG